MAELKTSVFEKKGWIANYTLVGRVVLPENNRDRIFTMDKQSEKSDWIYNRANLQIDCGEKHGRIFVQAMGGYGANRDNVCYVHGKDENGKDDFQNQYPIAWEDRFDDSILEDIGRMCFYNVTLEKDDKGEPFKKKFVSEYDLVEYMNEYLEDGMIVTVKGNITYQFYNGNVSCNKNITNIYLTNAEPKDFKAEFVQSFLIDRDSCTKDSINKDKSVLEINAYVLEKFKEFNGYDLTEDGKLRGGQLVPMRTMFEYPIDMTTDAGKNKMKLIMTKFFKVKKGITQLTMHGEFIESGATQQMTYDELEDDVKELIDIGMMTEEEALAECATNGNRERRMVIVRPLIKKIEKNDVTYNQIQKFEGKYDDDALDLYFLIPKTEEDEGLPFAEEEKSVEEEVTEEDPDDWINSLM